MLIPVIICEGAAEQAIIDLLLDNHCLKFERQALLFEQALTPISGSLFQEKILAHDFHKDTEGDDNFDDEFEDTAPLDIELAVHVIQDSSKRELKIVNHDIRHWVKTITYYVTKSEIEAIQLRSDFSNKQRYERFKKKTDGKIKPSQFMRKPQSAGGLGIPEVKTYQFVYDLWAQRIDRLIIAINDVAHEMHKKKSLRGSKSNYVCLAELLKPNYQD